MPVDFNEDISFQGSGRTDPGYPPQAKRGTDSLASLNYGKGTRIRVVEDNGRRGLVGLEGVVVSSMPGSVTVVLENDPVLSHRVIQRLGFGMARGPIRRHFRVTEVERVV